MKKILLPTDFSNNAWNALFTSLKLYTDVACHFYLLNAHEPNFANLMGNKGKQRLGFIYDSMEAYSNQELDKMLDYLKKNHKNSKHSFEKISRTDDLVSAITEMVLKKDVEMIIMGTQGATGAKEVFMGSNTVKAIKAIRNRPVIAVPENYDFKALKNIVFPTDFMRPYERFELKPLVELASLWTTKILVFQVGQEFLMNDIQIANRELLSERLEEIAHDFFDVEFKTGVVDAIGQFAKEQDADMVSLVHYEHTFMEKLIREPVVKKVAFHSKVPFLVLPELS